MTRDAAVADEIRVTGGGVDKTSETSSLACCLERNRGEDAEFWLICLASLKLERPETPLEKTVVKMLLLLLKRERSTDTKIEPLFAETN